ncbi:hypothetical protein [Miniphocaeibacter halophilus]|uniref:Uncharacterized protein n=1 Tax=Miniphocaeibacter halophilus TaxID=2931922 RepID=A0AC61N0W5_9FIRM|nr:hypothetical protein [Miniphocaeibacter halophilus]QQK08576.1 hypothetical protein JFY71_03280 [Miniphocaeibacter halophilus]
MNYFKISDKFTVKKLNMKNINEIYRLCKTNPQYYEYSKGKLSREFVLKDLKALPKGKDYNDKYYLGFYEGNKLVAVMDLIDK